MDIIDKIKKTETIAELDALREETAKAMMDPFPGREKFGRIQKEFRRQKNRLRRRK